MSDSGDPLSFIVAIHSLSGQTQLSDSMTIQPGAKLPIDMRSLLTSLGADAAGTFSQGSVSVYFEGTIMPLVGQMTIENPSRHWVQQAEMVENDPGRTDIPAVLSGQWWGLAGGRDATIMVTNASGGMVTADVILAFGGKEHKLDPLVFNPNETKLLSVASMLGTLNMSVAQAPEGRITIIQQGSNPSLVAQGRVTDPVTGFSTTLEFPDPARQHASALHASGVPVGTPTPDSPYSGDGAFTPHVIASNLSNKPQTLTLSVDYPKAVTWNSTNGPGGPAAPQVRFVGILKKGEKDPNVALDNPPNPDPSVLTGEYTLGPLTVGPDSTADLSLAAVMNQLPLPIPYASIRIRYSGAPGSMIAQVSSVDARQDLVVDARTANELDGWAGSGANPWHVDSQTDSILFLTDEGEKQVHIGFSVTAGGVHYYLTSLQLAPHETRTVNIRELRDAQAADFQGNKIPAGATDGSVNWVRLDSVPVEGRLMVIQKQQGMASNYDCSICNCPAVFRALAVAPATFGLIPLAYENMGSTATYYSCNTGTYYYDVTAGSSWSSNNTPVIKMDSSVHYRADAVSGGNASVTGSYSNCTQYDTNPDLDCPCINWPTYTASGGGTVVTVTASGAAYIPLRTGTSNGPNSNTYIATGAPAGGTYSWSSTSSKVSLSNGSSSVATVTAVSASAAIGDVPIKVQYSLNGTTNSATVNITVEQPTSLQVYSDTTNASGHSCIGGSGANGCGQSHFSGSGSYNSYLRNRTYQIMDQFSPARWIQGYNLQIQESYLAPTGQCSGDTVVTTSGIGDEIPDCFYFCSATCQSGGSCSVSSTQTVTVNGFVVATKSVNWTCAGVSVSP